MFIFIIKWFWIFLSDNGLKICTQFADSWYDINHSVSFANFFYWYCNQELNRHWLVVHCIDRVCEMMNIWTEKLMNLIQIFFYWFIIWCLKIWWSFLKTMKPFWSRWIINLARIFCFIHSARKTYKLSNIVDMSRQHILCEGHEWIRIDFIFTRVSVIEKWPLLLRIEMSTC